MSPEFFPALNATLNGITATLLLIGHSFITREPRTNPAQIKAHRAFMISAVCTSTLFLTSYLYYHFHFRLLTPFKTQGLIRYVYFTLLTSHTILAACLVPMIMVTLSRALRERYDAHRRIARFTYPVWLYVSTTGVIIYFMLYHWFRS
jgi:uncharacterized membrane protein YozB (DUF420 family)